MEPSRFFQIISRTRQGIPEILSNQILQKQNTGAPRHSFKLLQKQYKTFRRFFRTTLKTKRKSLEILSYYFKNKTKDLRDTFKPLQKQNTGDLPDCFKLLRKQNTKCPEVLSYYFKNRTNNRHDSFKLFKKLKHKVSPRFF